MRLNDGFANRQAESSFALNARPGLINAVKSFENVRQIFLGNADAGIGHRQKSRSIFSTGRDTYFALFTIKMDRIREQIGHHLSEALGVAHAVDLGQFAADLHTTLGCEGAH
jgi:hypothetical protein